MEKASILKILHTNKTVFSFKDILLANIKEKPNLLKRKINYYVKNKELYPIRRGFYAKDKNYDRFELATKIYTPAYISFETVLTISGINFQYYGQIFAASYLSREIIADGQTFVYKKIKDPILTNHAGIEKKENYYIASPERALLDVLYINKDYYFDNLRSIDWKKVEAILPIYNNKRMEKKVKEHKARALKGLK